MEFTLIITVALAAAIIVIVLVLVAVIVYQRWRIGEKNAALGKFINEIFELSDELDEVAGGTHRFRKHYPNKPVL